MQLLQKKDTKQLSLPRNHLRFSAILPFQQGYSSVNRQQLDTPNAIDRSFPLLQCLRQKQRMPTQSKTLERTENTIILVTQDNKTSNLSPG